MELLGLVIPFASALISALSNESFKCQPLFVQVHAHRDIVILENVRVDIVEIITIAQVVNLLYPYELLPSPVFFLNLGNHTILNMIFCTYCGKRFTRKEHLERHIPSRAYPLYI